MFFSPPKPKPQPPRARSPFLLVVVDASSFTPPLKKREAAASSRQGNGYAVTPLPLGGSTLARRYIASGGCRSIISLALASVASSRASASRRRRRSSAAAYAAAASNAARSARRIAQPLAPQIGLVHARLAVRPLRARAARLVPRDLRRGRGGRRRRRTVLHQKRPERRRRRVSRGGGGGGRRLLSRFRRSLRRSIRRLRDDPPAFFAGDEPVAALLRRGVAAARARARRAAVDVHGRRVDGNGRPSFSVERGERLGEKRALGNLAQDRVRRGGGFFFFFAAAASAARGRRSSADRSFPTIGCSSDRVDRVRSAERPVHLARVVAVRRQERVAVPNHRRDARVQRRRRVRDGEAVHQPSREREPARVRGDPRVVLHERNQERFEIRDEAREGGGGGGRGGRGRRSRLGRRLRRLSRRLLRLLGHLGPRRRLRRDARRSLALLLGLALLVVVAGDAVHVPGERPGHGEVRARGRFRAAPFMTTPVASEKKRKRRLLPRGGGRFISVRCRGRVVVFFFVVVLLLRRSEEDVVVELLVRGFEQGFDEREGVQGRTQRRARLVPEVEEGEALDARGGDVRVLAHEEEDLGDVPEALVVADEAREGSLVRQHRGVEDEPELPSLRLALGLGPARRVRPERPGDVGVDDARVAMARGDEFGRRGVVEGGAVEAVVDVDAEQPGPRASAERGGDEAARRGDARERGRAPRVLALEQRFDARAIRLVHARLGAPRALGDAKPATAAEVDDASRSDARGRARGRSRTAPGPPSHRPPTRVEDERGRQCAPGVDTTMRFARSFFFHDEASRRPTMDLQIQKRARTARPAPKSTLPERRVPKSGVRPYGYLVTHARLRRGRRLGVRWSRPSARPL